MAEVPFSWCRGLLSCFNQLLFLRLIMGLFVWWLAKALKVLQHLEYDSLAEVTSLASCVTS